MRRWVELVAGLMVIFIGLLLIGRPQEERMKVTVQSDAVWGTERREVGLSVSSMEGEDVGLEREAGRRRSLDRVAAAERVRATR